MRSEEEDGEPELTCLSFASISALGGRPGILAAKHQVQVPLLLLQNLNMELDAMIQVYNPSNGKAEAGGLPQVGGELEISDKGL